MRVLGAILAGGASRRFGGDKAAADLHGVALLDHVRGALAPQVAAIVVAGRSWPGMIRVDDHPVAGLGPLGGLCGALRYAEDVGFDAVLSAPCDVPDLPAELCDRLADAGVPSVVSDQPVIGLWRAGDAARLGAHLSNDADHSMRAWATLIGARRVALGRPLRNINHRTDLSDEPASLTGPGKPAGASR